MTRMVCVIGWVVILTIIRPIIMTSIKLIASACLLISCVAQASLYRWVDENGKVHFSDKVPPAMAQKGHTELKKNGVEEEHISSAEELRLKHEQEQKQRELELEKSQERLAEQEQQRKDEQLLATYETREEIIDAYRKKISLIDQSIGILSARDESLGQKLVRLKKQHKSSQDDMSRVTLAMQIESTQESLLEYQKAITVNRLDRKSMMEKYRETLVRFDHLSKLHH